MSVKIAEVVRAGRVESSHFGDVAVVAADGRLTAWAGDPERFVYPRSALKPVQALAVVESGAADRFGFSDEDIALCAASHNGEPMHVERVEEMLLRAGLTENALLCGSHPPRLESAAADLWRSGREPSALHNNCSGKHAGMLAAARVMGAPADSYLALGHPVQVHIRKALSVLSGVPEQDLAAAVDGCGAPVYGLPLAALALVFARLAAPERAPAAHADGLRRVRDAMRFHPEMVGGTGRFCTAFLSAGAGRWVGKAGAEGVYGVGVLATGEGVAVKVEDGNSRAVYPAVLSVMAELGHLAPGSERSLAEFGPIPVKNVAGNAVGEVRACFRLDRPA